MTVTETMLPFIVPGMRISEAARTDQTVTDAYTGTVIQTIETSPVFGRYLIVAGLRGCGQVRESRFHAFTIENNTGWHIWPPQEETP